MAILTGRPNAANLRSEGKVAGNNGLILLPDGWVIPDGLSFLPGYIGYEVDLGNDEYEYHVDENIYTAAQWALMEAAGAVFLPDAGSRVGGYGNMWNGDKLATTTNSETGFYSWVDNVQNFGYYWSSTLNPSDSNFAYYLICPGMNGALTEFTAPAIWSRERRRGNSVRLVRELETPAPADPITIEGIGAFSVSANKKIEFASANLQYHTGTGQWRVAEHQYDIVGETDNLFLGTPGHQAWVDLFAWSCESVPYGVSPSNKDADYTGDFIDWGGLTDSDWYTLTKDEWQYLLTGRPNAANLRGEGSVADMYGLILLPDEWVIPAGLSFLPGYIGWAGDTEEEWYSENVFTAEQWALMEAAGAVFLPNAGSRVGGYGNMWNGDKLATQTNPETGFYSWVSNVGDMAYYWSSTMHPTNSNLAYYLISPGMNGDLSEYTAPAIWSRERRRGNSVRLVRELPEAITLADALAGEEGDVTLSEVLKVVEVKDGAAYSSNGNEWVVLTGLDDPVAGTYLKNVKGEISGLSTLPAIAVSVCQEDVESSFVVAIEDYDLATLTMDEEGNPVEFTMPSAAQVVTFRGYVFDGYLRGYSNNTGESLKLSGGEDLENGKSLKLTVAISIDAVANGAPRRAQSSDALSGVTGIVLTSEVPTGIDEIVIDHSKGDGTYYNLLGQPVKTPTSGIYIRDGKKVVVK